MAPNIQTINDYSIEFQRVIKETENKNKKNISEQLNILQKHKRFEITKDDSKITGMMQFNKLFEVLRRIESVRIQGSSDPKYKLSVDQNKFAKSFIVAMIPIIFTQQEVSLYLPELMAQFGFDEILPITLLTTYRRFGKSFLMAVLSVCAAMAIKDATILSFAPTLRSSSRQMETMFDILIDINGGSTVGIIDSYSKTQYLYINNCWGRISKVRAMPANSTIGVNLSGDILILFNLFFFTQGKHVHVSEKWSNV